MQKSDSSLQLPPCPSRYTTQIRRYSLQVNLQGNIDSSHYGWTTILFLGTTTPKSKRLIRRKYSVLTHTLLKVPGLDKKSPPEHIRSISDPEHPLTLEQLAVVSAPQIEVEGNHVLVEFTPTVPHCGMSTLIGMKNNTRS